MQSLVGVDIVDVDDSRCIGKTRNAIFLSRVLAEDERTSLDASGDSDELLWRFWSAKEAAFKVVTKIRGTPPTFVHSAFRISPVDAFPPLSVCGMVRWEGLTIYVRWHVLPGRVAAVAWNGPLDQGDVKWGWGAATELDPAPNEPLDALEVEESRVAVICDRGLKGRVPPQALLDGLPAPVDVSLSHHGRWLAWAIRLSQG